MAIKGNYETKEKEITSTTTHPQNHNFIVKKGTTMNLLTQFKKISILPVCITLAFLALAAPVAALASEVTNWNQIATNTLAAFPAPAGGAAPSLQINMGMTQGAVYDAVNAIEPRHQPYLLTTQFSATASKEAAVATAA
jgi:hypothetical protein